MKMIAVFLLCSNALLGQMHWVFVSANQPFTISNSDQTAPRQTAWLAISKENNQVQILLENGKQLVRSFEPHVEHAYYQIVYNKVRYRPNQILQKADTLYISKTTPVLAQTEIKAPQANSSVLLELEAIPYEWEKSEFIIATCLKEMPSCPVFLTYLQQLKYPPSRVDVLNALAHKLSDECFEQAKELLPEHAQNMLKKP